jgi:hypothetical protein
MKISFSFNNKFDSKVIYVLYIQKNFVNFNKSHPLYLMHLNTFFWEGVRMSQQTLKGVHGTTG